MSRFDFDRGMGIRGIGGTRPTSFEYMPPQRDPVVDAIVSRRDANDSINRATDQYEADVADFKNTAATEKEEGLISLLPPEPTIDRFVPPMINENRTPFIPPRNIQDIDERKFRDSIGLPPPVFRDEPPFTPKPPQLPPVFDDNPFKDIFTPPFEPPIEEPPFRPPFEPPIEEPPFRPPFEPPIDDNRRRKPPRDDDFIDGPPNDGPMYVPPIDGPPDGPPYVPPIDGPPDEIPIIPPPPPPPPSSSSGPINPYTGKPISNPYTPYSTESGATPLIRTISPRTFGQAPGFERPIGGPPISLPIKPPRTPIEPPIMCFVAGTKIDMADGTKKVIENIMVGDEVMAQNNTTDKVSYVHDIPEDDRQLWTINNRITATDSHAFLTKDGWKSNNAKLSNTVYNDYGIEVKDLQIGDELITNDGVEKITTLKNKEDFVKVYNFSTDSTHTYMVDGVVSHNKLPPDFDDLLRPQSRKNGGALNTTQNNGIMRLPQSQQGDTMTTQMFQRAFRPRR